MDEVQMEKMCFSYFLEIYKDDTIFGNINKNFISLKDEETKKNNEHLRRILTEGLIPIMKRNELFNEMYKKINYAGSFYKGTKVGKPNEYDLDLIVQLPFNYESVELDTEHEHHGSVKIKIEEKDKLPAWEKHGKILNKWIDKNGYLNQNKFRQWMESLMSKTFEQLEKRGKDYNLIVDDETYVLKNFSKSGPAFTLNIRLKDEPVKQEIMSVDLVPSLEFKDRLLKNYKTIPGMAPAFIVVPKPLDKVGINGGDLWRLSFYDLEKRILLQKEFAKVKPVIRMLKKFRDRQQMKPIASYFIETLCLHELMCRKSDIQFFRAPLTSSFMFMLKRLSEVLRAKCLYFFWHEEHNLLSNFDEKVLENYGNRIRNIVIYIEKNYFKDRFVISAQILTGPEFVNLLTKIADDNSNNLTAGSSSTTDNKSFDVKQITDEMMKHYNLNELTHEEFEIIINNIKDKLPPDTVQEIENASRNYIEPEENTSYWRPIGRFLNKIFSPRLIFLTMPGLVETLHRNNPTNSGDENVKIYKPS